jgi:hypothetical protein
MAQKQIAPTTQIIKTPIKTESMATLRAGSVTALAASDERKIGFGSSSLSHPEAALLRHFRRHLPGFFLGQQLQEHLPLGIVCGSSKPPFEDGQVFAV